MRASNWFALAVLPFCLVQCASDRAAPPEVPGRAREALVRGLTAEAGGRTGEAKASYREAIAAAPGFVDAHRAWQNVLMSEGRRGDLRAEYGEWLAESPTSAERIYLRGRLDSDVAAQRSACELAVSLDPTLYFGWVGLGYTALEQRDAKAARAAFERAIQLEPKRPEALRGALRLHSRTAGDEARAQALEISRRLHEIDPLDASAVAVMVDHELAEKRRDAAFRVALELASTSPFDDAAVLLGNFLDRNGTQLDHERVRAVLAPLVGERSSREWRRLAVRVEVRCGDSREALRILDAGGEPATRADRRSRRSLLTSTGELSAALADVVADRFASGFDLGGSVAEIELRRLTEAPLEMLRGDAASNAIDVLLRHGLDDLAIATARAILGEAPTEHGVRTKLDAALRHRRFVSELAAWFERAYSGDSTTERSLDEFILAARALSIECLGRDVTLPVVKREYFAIGEFLDPDPAHGGGLAAYFDSFGEFLVVGRRMLGPIDGYLLRKICATNTSIDGRPVLRVLGEDLIIPSRIESIGGEIAGFALETFIVLNVDRARVAAERARLEYEVRRDLDPPVLEDAIDVATSREERRSLREPSSVVLRTWLRSYAEHLAAGGTADDYAGVVLDEIESHERLHIRDAHEFLPVLSDVPAKVDLLARNAFLGANVEAWLEGRAQLGALRDAKDPRIALAEVMRDLPDRGASPPHSAGYYDVVEKLVRVVDDGGADFPSIAPGRVIVQQLDRLSAPEILEAARRVIEMDAARR